MAKAWKLLASLVGTGAVKTEARGVASWPGVPVVAEERSISVVVSRGIAAAETARRPRRKARRPGEKCIVEEEAG